MSEAKDILEAILFSAQEPLAEAELADRLPPGADVAALLAELSADYDGRGIHLSLSRSGVAIRTRPEASDLAPAFVQAPPRLTRAAMETLAVVAAYDVAGKPVTRGEIERIRGVSQSQGVMDALLACGYVNWGRRRDTPGRPLTVVVTDAFYDAFGIRELGDIEAYASMVEDGLTVLPPLERADTVEASEAAE